MKIAVSTIIIYDMYSDILDFKKNRAIAVQVQSS
jgi:hypothetical protein